MAASKDVAWHTLSSTHDEIARFYISRHDGWIHIQVVRLNDPPDVRRLSISPAQFELITAKLKEHHS